MIRIDFKPWSKLLVVSVLSGIQLTFGSAGELPVSLLLDLGNSEFKVREKAQSELLAKARLQPGPSTDELFHVSKISADPETRQRCFEILRHLLTDQYMKEGQGFVGIGRFDKAVELEGQKEPCNAVLVTSVRRGTPADRAGIQVNDLILALNGTYWKEPTASEIFANQIAALKPGTKVTLLVYRDDKKIELDLVLVRRPAGLGNEFIPGQPLDPDKAERDALEAYIQDWFNQKSGRN